MHPPIRVGVMVMVRGQLMEIEAEHPLERKSRQSVLPWEQN